MKMEWGEKFTDNLTIAAIQIEIDLIVGLKVIL